MPKSKPIITHTEIISRAIRSIETEIDKWRDCCKGFPEEQAESFFDASTKDMRAKLDALKQMYLIETGTNYI